MAKVSMAAIWGRSGSGKTALCSALAAQLAALQRNTVIISTNSSVPALPLYLPGEHFGPDQSLGALLNMPMKNFNALKGFIHIHPSDARVGIMGIASGESPLSYKAFKRTNMMELLRLLNDSPFDYVLFDCLEDPTRDPMTLLALSTSEVVTRMITPDVQGIEFERSQLAWLSGASNMRVGRHIRIFSPVYPFSPLEEVIRVTGQADYQLPFSHEVYGKLAGGQLVRGCRDHYGIQYDKVAKQLAERMVRDEPTA